MNNTKLSATFHAPQITPTWQRVLLMLIIFVSGMVVGAYTTGVVIRGKIIESIQAPETVPPKIAARIRRLLSLDDEQTSQVTTIIDRHRLEIQKIRREFQPQIEQQLNEAQGEITAILRDDQRELWQEHFTEMRKQWLPPIPSAE